MFHNFIIIYLLYFPSQTEVSRLTNRQKETEKKHTKYTKFIRMIIES